MTWDCERKLGRTVEFCPVLGLTSSGEALAQHPKLRKVENPVYRFPEQGGLSVSER
jgi:hypothetical protein